MYVYIQTKAFFKCPPKNNRFTSNKKQFTSRNYTSIYSTIRRNDREGIIILTILSNSAALQQMSSVGSRRKKFLHRSSIRLFFFFFSATAHIHNSTTSSPLLSLYLIVTENCTCKINKIHLTHPSPPAM